MERDHQLTKKQFYQLAENRHKYRVIKKLTGELSYSEIGSLFYSDTLYKRGYNMSKLVEDGYLELMDEPFDFQKQIVGKNVHSVYIKCPECSMWGISEPLSTECGNCGYTKCITYYSAETIQCFLTLTP